MSSLTFASLILASCLVVSALPSTYDRSLTQTNASVHFNDLYARDTSTGADSYLSFIKKLAAVGDSYSAGIGAGTRLTGGSSSDGGSDYECSRYDHSYPYLVNQDSRLGDPTSRNFQFKSCSGAVIQEVIDKQLPYIDGGQQAILLSAGGNDVGLVDVLNDCIFQWMTISGSLLDKAKANAQTYAWASSVDWDKLHLGCDARLADTQTLIDSSSFSDGIDRVIAAAKNKLTSDGIVYYTGYAKFFAEDLTTDCDKVSWSLWIKASGLDGYLQDQYLTVDHRRRMNQLVDAVNSKLSAGVARAGSQVKFVGYDRLFGESHGRFCEAGVDESTIASNTRNGLMFYEWNTLDPSGNNPQKRSPQDAAIGTFQADQNILAQITLLGDGNAQLKYVDDSQQPSKDQDKTVVARSVIPDGYARVFHPQILGHQVIANLVVLNMFNTWIDSPAACTYQAPDSSTTDISAEDPNAPQTIAIASYINPKADPNAWNKLISYDGNKVSVLVANVLNGPDNAINYAWKDVIDRAHNSGKRVIGYVRTGYLGVSAQKFTTRLGSLELADWIAQIEADVQMWYFLYGDSIDGIFFDEGWPECGPNNIYADIYAFINRRVKTQYPKFYTVLNPGSPMAKCYDATMDTLLTFESSYEQYTTNYVPNDWTPSDPRKIWHIIYNVPRDQVSNVAQLSKSRGAGLVEINNNIMPNPYDKLPDDDYMNAFLGSIAGGSPRVKSADPYPSVGASPNEFVNRAVRSISYDYSSISVGWPSTEGAIGYSLTAQQSNLIYQMEFPSTISRVTVGGFDSTMGNVQISMRPLGANGQQMDSIGGFESPLTPLPGGHTINGLHHTLTDTQAIFEADVLVPYAFVRMYLCCLNSTCAFDKPAWTIQWNQNGAAYCRYMVEGFNFYNYIGSNGAWSWAPVAGCKLENTGYHYKWTWPVSVANEVLPGGLAYIVQGEGYNWLTNIWYPCTYSTGEHINEQPYPGTWCEDGKFS